MARPFLEETIDVCARYGTSFDEHYAVINTVDAGGNSYGKLIHPHPMLRYDLNHDNTSLANARQDILDLYHRSFGTFGGFRLRHRTDYSTNNFVDAPTFSDQTLIPATVSPSPLRWQLVRWYGTQVMGQSPLRIIRKPVPGSVLIGIRDLLGIARQAISRWSVDTTTGIVTFINQQRNITAIAKGTTTTITVGSGHGYTVGDIVHVSGVSGMTEINGLRSTVTATSGTTITVDINSVPFTDYDSGGQTNTAPQSGESPTGGAYFDIPVRFESDITGANFNNFDVLSMGINVVEILNP